MSMSVVMQFAFTTLLPVAACVLLSVLRRRTAVARLSNACWQVIVGIVFGAIAVYGTEAGIPLDGAVMNVRDAAPLAAGLFFGGPAGIIAGVIGGAERWLAVMWGVGEFTQLACSLGTVFAGLYAAFLRKYLFDGRAPSWSMALATGMIAEVMHMVLIFVTNLDQAVRALQVVRACVLPMVGCVSLSVCLSALALAALNRQHMFLPRSKRGVAEIVQSRLLVAIAVAFCITVGFTWVIQASLSRADTAALLALSIEDVKQEILDASEAGPTGDPLERVRSSVENRHVGQTGELGVIDEFGNIASSRGGALSDSGEEFGADAVEAGAGNLFVTTFNGERCYAMYQQAEGYNIAAVLPISEANMSRDVGVLLISLMEILIYAVLFLVMYFVIKRVVVRSIRQVNGRLDKIMRGDLSVTIDVRESSEFSSLSDDINATVGSLKDSMAEVQGRIDRELATAKAIQESALPRTFPPFPEVDSFDLFASMKTAREVGGDFYDFFMLDDERVGLVIADVSGKGVPAALFMMAAKTEIRACMESGMGLVESIKTANWQLCQGNDASMFVTVFAAVLDYRTGLMEYVNAGHNPPLLRRDGSWQWLRDRSGLFLGAYPKIKLRGYEIYLRSGDELLLYTDGVTEAWDPNEENFGENRLEEFLAGRNDLHPHALVNAIIRELTRWADGADQADDITVLCLEYGILPISTDTLEVPATVEELEHVTDFVNAELARRLCPVSVQNKVDICLEELFVNVASYAYGDKVGNAQVTYTYLPDPAGIRVEVIDAGVPFDPLAKPDPERYTTIEDAPIGGLGIFMTKTIADSISYERREGRNVTMFELHW